MNKIAVTGSRGFIGSHLTKRLRSLNHEVIEIDISTGFDVTDFDTLKKIPEFDMVFHLAGKTFIPKAFEDPHSFYMTNVLGTLNMLELCRMYKSKFVFVSSYVYGKPEYLPIDEQHKTNAANPYMSSKLLGEQLCQSYFHDFNVPVIIIRPFNVYGIGQDDFFLIPKLIKQSESGSVELMDPRPKRDFVYIDDLVDAFVRCIDYQPDSCRIFNIGTGKSISVQDLAKMLVSKFNPNAKLRFSGEIRKDEILDTIADISRAGKDLEWHPKIDLEKGLEMLKASID